MIGGLAGFGLYYGYHALFNPTWVEHGAESTSQGLDLGINNLPKFLKILADQFRDHAHYTPFLLGFGLVGVVPALNRNTALDRLLLIVVLVAVVMLAAIYTRYRDYYIQHTAIPMIFLAAGLFDTVTGYLADKQQQIVLALLLVLVVVASVGMMIEVMPVSQGWNEALDLGQAVRGIVPVDVDVLIANDPMYFEFEDYQGFTDLTAAFLASSGLGKTEYEVLETLAPDAIVLWEDFPLQHHIAIHRQYLDDNADEYQLVRCWQTTAAGNAMLYMRQLPEGTIAQPDCILLP